MPNFAYVARDMSGKQVTGTIEANGQREATTMLADRSLFPVSVKDSTCLLYTSPSPRDRQKSRMPSSA